MSVAVSTLVWRCRGISAADKIVLLRLADAATAEGLEARPSVETMAADCGCSDRHVKAALKRLTATGLIRVDRPSIGRMPNVYAFNMAVLEARAADATTPVRGMRRGGHGSPQGHAGVNAVHPSDVFGVNEVHPSNAAQVNEVHPSEAREVNGVHPADAPGVNDVHLFDAPGVNNVHPSDVPGVNDVHLFDVPGVNTVHPSGPSGVNEVHPRGERGAPQGVNVIHPNRPIPVQEPSQQQQPLHTSAARGAGQAAAAAATAAPDEPSKAVVIAPTTIPTTEAIALIEAARAGLTDGGCATAARPNSADLATARDWLDLGADPPTVRAVARMVAARRAARDQGPPQSLAYLSGAIADALAPPPDPAVTPLRGPRHDPPSPIRSATDRAAQRTTDALEALRRRGEARILAAGGRPAHDP